MKGRLGLFLTNVCNRNCEFCFRRQSYPQAQWMTEQAFEAFVGWVQRADVAVSVAGGEPTLHPQFAEAIRELRICTQGLLVISNLLCGPEPLEAIRGVDLLANADSLDQYTVEELALFEKNLSRVVEQENDVALAFTIWRQDQPDEHLLDYCVRYGVRKVRLDLARPSILRHNRCVRTSQIPQFKPTLMATARRLTECGIRILFDCPLPPSLLTSEDLAEIKPLALRFTRPSGLCSTAYVNPDLTISSCPHQILVSNLLTEFDDYADLMETVLISKQCALRDVKQTCEYYCEAEHFLKCVGDV